MLCWATKLLIILPPFQNLYRIGPVDPFNNHNILQLRKRTSQAKMGGKNKWYPHRVEPTISQKTPAITGNITQNHSTICSMSQISYMKICAPFDACDRKWVSPNRLQPFDHVIGSRVASLFIPSWVATRRGDTLLRSLLKSHFLHGNACPLSFTSTQLYHWYH